MIYIADYSLFIIPVLYAVALLLVIKCISK